MSDDKETTMPADEVKLFWELPEWLAEAIRPPGDPRTAEQALKAELVEARRVS